MTNLLTPELTKGCADFIKRYGTLFCMHGLSLICFSFRSQTYEGGIGPYPGKEAHNGYTFCGLAAMEILGETHVLNVDKLIVWLYGLYHGG